MINMEAIPKFDIKSVIKSDIKFDISTKLTTWIGHKSIKKYEKNTWNIKCSLWLRLNYYTPKMRGHR